MSLLTLLIANWTQLMAEASLSNLAMATPNLLQEEVQVYEEDIYHMRRKWFDLQAFT